VSKVGCALGRLNRLQPPVDEPPQAEQLKRKKVLHAVEQNRPDVAAARKEPRAEQPALQASRLVFVDETDSLCQEVMLAEVFCSPTMPPARL
jgi:hypothetical protein